MYMLAETRVIGHSAALTCFAEEVGGKMERIGTERKDVILPQKEGDDKPCCT